MMQSGKQQSNSKQVLWIAMGGIGCLGLSLLSAAILSRYLSKEEYGTYKQILYVYNTLAIMFTAGLPSVYTYFLPRYSVDKGRNIVRTISKLLFFAGIAFSACLFLFSGLIACLLKNPELTVGLKWFSPIPMLLLPTMGIRGIFSSYKKAIHIAVYGILSRFIELCFVVAPVIILKGSYLYAIHGWVVASFITLILASYLKETPFDGVAPRNADLSLKDIFAYSLPLVAASLAGMAMRAADQFYISRFFGTAVFADFSNGFTGLPFAAIVTSSVSTVLTPLFSKQIHLNIETAYIADLWRSALQRSALLIYPMTSFFVFHAGKIVVLLYSDSYHGSAIYFRIALIGTFFDIIVFAPLLLAAGKTKFYSNVTLVFAALSWATGYLAVIVFNSPVAIAILSVSLRIVRITVCMKYVSNLLKLNFLQLIPINKIAIITLHSLSMAYITSIAVARLCPSCSTIESLGINVTAFTGFLLLTAKLVNLDYLQVIQPVFGKIINNFSGR